MLKAWMWKSCVMAGAVLSLSCVEVLPRPMEVCGNGMDDDEDGQVDCVDSDCAALEVCAVPTRTIDSNYKGPCKMCGKTCSKQSECLDVSFQKDEPLPLCLSGVCDGLRVGVRIRFEVDTSDWAGMGVSLRSINTRLVQKKAVDGSEVTCARLRQEASSKQAVDANQLERSGKFNFLSFDVTAVNASPGDVIVQPLMIAGTGSDYVIWTELWAGAVDSNTKLPTGNRLGVACVETGSSVAPIVAEHDWSNPKYESTRRTLRVNMPLP